MMSSSYIGNRGCRRLAAVGLATLLTASILTCNAMTACPTIAYAEDTSNAEAVISKANDLKSKISDAQSKYLQSVADQGKAEAERDEARQSLDKTNSELSDARTKLSAIVKSSYSTDSSHAADLIVGAKTLPELISGIASSTKVETELSNQTQQVSNLQQRQSKQVKDCEAKVNAAKKAATDAQTQKEQFQQQLSDMSGEIQSVSSALSAEIAAEPSKAAQMQSTLDYMQNVYNVTDTQARIISSAFKSSYSGASMCEAWVEKVYRNAGISIARYPDAYADYVANVKSTSMTDIKAGALLYSSGSGSYYAHVGIALTDSMGADGMDTLVLDNEGSRTGVVTMRKWVSWMNASPRNGKTGFFGWGYPSSTNLG
jgi:peptidoglycan hydrolase CwlO-like protein